MTSSTHCALAIVAALGLVSCSAPPTAEVFRVEDPVGARDIGRVVRTMGFEDRLGRRVTFLAGGSPVTVTLQGWQTIDVPSWYYSSVAKDAPAVEQWAVAGRVQAGVFSGRSGKVAVIYAAYASEKKPRGEYPSADPIEAGIVLVDAPNWELTNVPVYPAVNALTSIRELKASSIALQNE